MHETEGQEGWRWLYLALPSYWGPTGAQAVKDRHADLWFEAVSELDGDDRWLTWWLGHGPARPDCALVPHFQDEQNKADVASADSPEERALLAPREGLSRTAEEVRLYLRFDADWAVEPGDLQPLVHRQVFDAMSQLQACLHMTPHPPPPWSP